MHGSQVVCILGMHRSGTSMVAQLLNKCGLDLGPPEQLLPPSLSNPLGHFENRGFLEINEALLTHLGGAWDNPAALKDGWEQDSSLEPFVQEAKSLIDEFSECPVWGWKEPRTTILLPFWKSLISDLRFVICMRSPLEVAQSLADRDGMETEKGTYLWDHYVRAAIRDTEGFSRVFTFYEDFFREPLNELDRITKFCGLSAPDDLLSLDNAISHELRHHDTEILSLLAGNKIEPKHKLFYIGLRSLATQTPSSLPSDPAHEVLKSNAFGRYAELTEESDTLTLCQDKSHTGGYGGSNKSHLGFGLEERDRRIAELSFQLATMQESAAWKVLEGLRHMLPHDSQRRALYLILRRAAGVLRQEGPYSLLRKAGRRVHQAITHQRPLLMIPAHYTLQEFNARYQAWLQRNCLSSDDIARMKANLRTRTYTPCISIVVPVYNTDETWLRKAIDSVRAQGYPHWELCLVNDCSTKPQVRSVLDEYGAVDPRIRVKHLDRNVGIAGASAQALSLATGEFVGLLDHDDELSPDALYEVVSRLNQDPELDLLYSDEDKVDLSGLHVEPFFKPDWSPDLLLSMNYITHFSVFRRALLEQVGGFRPGFDGSQDYDLLLRFTEETSRIAHIPRVLYHWRKIPGSAAMSEEAKPYAYKAGQRAIAEALSRRQQDGTVESIVPGRYMVRYQLGGNPLVSIIIPTRDKVGLLRQCLKSIEEKTSYTRYEIIVVDNGSVEPETIKYLDAISSKYRVCQYPGQFNFAAICNFGAVQAKGSHLLFLNNDTQVIKPDWLTAMLEQAQRPEVGAVGAKLLYPDGRIQHAGMVMGINGSTGHAFRYLPRYYQSYCGLAEVVRNCSAVTAACMMVPRAVFDEVDGFDERFRVVCNDVDLCFRIRQRGHLVVYTPQAMLFHHESASRGSLHPLEDQDLFLKQWGDLIRDGDPYYNPNLTLAREDWSLRP